MQNGHFPKIIYGTAWKESATTTLVEEAVLAGLSADEVADIERIL